MVVILVPLIYFSVFNEQPKETNPVSESNIEETENKFLCEYLGKTAFDVKKDFEDNYELSALAGSSVMNYQSEKITFILDGFYEIFYAKARINYILSQGVASVTVKEEL